MTWKINDVSRRAEAQSICKFALIQWDRDQFVRHALPLKPDSFCTTGKSISELRKLPEQWNGQSHKNTEYSDNNQDFQQ